MKITSRRRWLASIAAAAVAVSAVLATVASAGAGATSSQPGGLGQSSGLLHRDHLTLESAIQVNLSKETVRLPLYPGTANGKKVWYVLLDASDAGLAHDLGVNYAPKLANIAIGDPAAVQTVTLTNPTPQANPFGPGVVNFAGAPNFAPTRVAEPGPNGFPLAKFAPGAVAGPGYSPFIRFAGSSVVYNAPIVATGNGPFDVVHHTNTGDRVLGIHIAGPSKPGQFAESWVDMLFVKGFDAGQPILYLSTDAGQPLTAVLERSVYVPALNNAAFNGGDDFLGSARERLFGFINGQTGATNPQAQGVRSPDQGRARFPGRLRWQHRDDQRPAQRRRLPERVRRLPDPQRPPARRRLQPAVGRPAGPVDPKAVKEGLNTRQIDENVVFNLAATRPDLLTGVNPATGQPAPYGADGVDINCAVIGFTAHAPTANHAPPAPNSQFPPR
jgi:hypothetical protein